MILSTVGYAVAFSFFSLIVVALLSKGIFLYRKLLRVRLQEMIYELYRFNRGDCCWDPIGSIDKKAMDVLIDTLIKNRLDSTQKILARRDFDQLKDIWDER